MSNPVINFHKSPSLGMVKVWMKEKGFTVTVDGSQTLDLQKGKTRIVFECIRKPLLKTYTCVTVYDEGRSRTFGSEDLKLRHINSI